MAEMNDKEKKGKFDILGGSLLLKIILLAGVGLIISVFIFGLPATIIDWLWAFAKIFVAIFIIVLVIRGIQTFLATPLYSPTEDFKTKIKRIAETWCRPIKNYFLFIYKGGNRRVAAPYW